MFPWRCVFPGCHRCIQTGRVRSRPVFVGQTEQLSCRIVEIGGIYAVSHGLSRQPACLVIGIADDLTSGPVGDSFHVSKGVVVIVDSISQLISIRCATACTVVAEGQPPAKWIINAGQVVIGIIGKFGGTIGIYSLLKVSSGVVRIVYR